MKPADPAAQPAQVPVCHVISSFHPIVGGAEKATQSLTAALRRRDHDVFVLTRRYSRELRPQEDVDGVPVFRLGLPGRGKVNALTFGLQALFTIGWPLRHCRVIHVQNIDTPLIVGMLARVLFRRRLVATIHGHTQIEARARSTRGRLRSWFMAKLVDEFTAINPEVTTALREAGVAPERVHAIPNGIDTNVFRPPSTAERARARSDLGFGTEDFVVVYIGRLVSWKRVDLLIDAWIGLAGQEPRTLVLVGDGPAAESLRARASHSESRIRFEGLSDRPTAYLWAADAFANASGDNKLQGEGLSVALLEAMASGVPPIVTQGPGNDVVVEDGDTGLSFPVLDVSALTAQLRRMREDVPLRRRLGRTASEQISQRYSIEIVAEQVGGLYDRLVPRPRL